MKSESTEPTYPWLFLMAMLAVIAIGSVAIPGCPSTGVSSGDVCTVAGRVHDINDPECSRSGSNGSSSSTSSSSSGGPG